MANIKNINKNITKPVDSYLKFIQQPFNTKDISFFEVFNTLTNISNNKNISDVYIKARASVLREELKQITLLTDFDKYKKFDKLGNLGFDNKGLLETYRLSNEIIRDINVARNWIKSYKIFEKEVQKLEKLKAVNTEDLHDELILLGQSILGRAIELTPIKTGTLRNSAVLLDFGTYIIIAFTAPYATYVHENMEIKHPHHVSNINCGGQAKFLEIALQEFFPDRTVWVEEHGFGGVQAKISLNPLYLEYKHYN